MKVAAFTGVGSLWSGLVCGSYEFHRYLVGDVNAHSDPGTIRPLPSKLGIGDFALLEDIPTFADPSDLASLIRTNTVGQEMELVPIRVARRRRIALRILRTIPGKIQPNVNLGLKIRISGSMPDETGFFRLAPDIQGFSYYAYEDPEDLILNAMRRATGFDVSCEFEAFFST